MPTLDPHNVRRDEVDGVAPVVATGEEVVLAENAPAGELIAGINRGRSASFSARGFNNLRNDAMFASTQPRRSTTTAFGGPATETSPVVASTSDCA
jgi:hypothetical protein